MQVNNLQFEIQSEQNNRLVAAVEAFLISFFAIITALLLPQLLFQFLMQNPDFNPNQSALLNNIPVVAYGVATFFVLYALLGNFLRVRRIRQLKQDLELMQFAFNDDGLEDSNALAEALAETSKEEKSVAKSASKSSAKTTKRASTRKSGAVKRRTAAKKTTTRRSTKKAE